MLGSTEPDRIDWQSLASSLMECCTSMQQTDIATPTPTETKNCGKVCKRSDCLTLTLEFLTST